MPPITFTVPHNTEAANLSDPRSAADATCQNKSASHDTPEHLKLMVSSALGDGKISYDEQLTLNKLLRSSEDATYVGRLFYSCRSGIEDDVKLHQASVQFPGMSEKKIVEYLSVTNKMATLYHLPNILIGKKLAYFNTNIQNTDLECFFMVLNPDYSLYGNIVGSRYQNNRITNYYLGRKTLDSSGNPVLTYDDEADKLDFMITTEFIERVRYLF